MKCPDKLVFISFEFEAPEMQFSGLARNKVLAALPTGLMKNLIFQFFDIATEIEHRISMSGLYTALSVTRFQRSETWVFQLNQLPIQCTLVEGVEGSSQAS